MSGKMIYQRPKMEIIELEKEEDIIRTSNDPNSEYHKWGETDGNTSDAGGKWEE